MTTVRNSARFTLLFSFAIVYVIWGSTYIAIRFAEETMPPLLMGGSRFMIAGTILCFVAFIKRDARPSFRELRSAAIVGTLLLACGNGFVIIAERVVPSALAALLISITPLWMILVDWLRPHGVRPTLVSTIGVIIGFGGVALLIIPHIQSLPPLDVLSFLVIPFGALNWAIGSVYARQTKMPKSPLFMNGIEMFAGGAVLLGAGTATSEWPSVHLSAISLHSLGAWLFLIIFGSIVGFSAYTYILKNSPLAIASTYAYVNPVVAVFLGWSLAGETITSLTLIAAAIIIGAVIIITTYNATRHTTSATVESATLPPLLEDKVTGNQVITDGNESAVPSPII